MTGSPDVRNDEGISQHQPWPADPLTQGFLAIGCRMVSTDHFRQAIRSRFELASAQGRQDLTIECGELYWSVSKLPVFDPWMVLLQRDARGNGCDGSFDFR